MPISYVLQNVICTSSDYNFAIFKKIGSCRRIFPKEETCGIYGRRSLAAFATSQKQKVAETV